MILGSFPDLVVVDVPRAVAYYRHLLELEVLVEQPWYAELGLQDRPYVAFVERGHGTVPSAVGKAASGVLVTFEVDDAAAAAARAEALGCRFELPLTTELGQRHFMLIDPDEFVVDVIERVPLTNADLRRLAAYRRHAT